MLLILASTLDAFIIPTLDVYTATAMHMNVREE